MEDPLQDVKMIGRMAGAALGVGKSLFKGMGPTEIVGRLAPDAMFGGLWKVR